MDEERDRLATPGDTQMDTRQTRAKENKERDKALKLSKGDLVT
jgi:hypothetical protein